MSTQMPQFSNEGSHSDAWRDILWSALRTFATQPTAITSETTRLFDQALHHPVAHAYGDDWKTPFLYACDNGLTAQIWRMISAHGGRASVYCLPSDYLDSCESLYFDSSLCPTLYSRYDSRLRALFEDAAVEAAYRENTAGTSGRRCRDKSETAGYAKDPRRRSESSNGRPQLERKACAE